MPFREPHRSLRPRYPSWSRTEAIRSSPSSARAVVKYVVVQSTMKSPRPTKVLSPLSALPSPPPEYANSTITRTKVDA